MTPEKLNNDPRRKNRCIFNANNYCLPYYFPNSFTQICQKQQQTGKRIDSIYDYLSADQEPNVLFDIIYSQTQDGELLIEWDLDVNRLSLLTFIDISSLYNDKQSVAYNMAKQLADLPAHPNILNINEPYLELHGMNQSTTIVLKTDCPEHILLWKQFCKTQFSTARLLLIFRQITSAVAHVHDHGLVHRDVHPTRLHWCNGKPVFNLIGLPYNFKKLLKGENFAGHLTFSAPELLAKPSAYDSGCNKVSQAVDIWSLGCCLYYFVVKKDPFEGSTPAQTKINIQNMTIGDQKINIPILDKLLTSCLVFDSLQRPTATQIMRVQDQLEIQEFGYPRSASAMEILNQNSYPTLYQTQIDNDPEFSKLSQPQPFAFLQTQIQQYQFSSQMANDEAEIPKLKQRSNAWFFSKTFTQGFNILEEGKKDNFGGVKIDINSAMDINSSMDVYSNSNQGSTKSSKFNAHPSMNSPMSGKYGGMNPNAGMFLAPVAFQPQQQQQKNSSSGSQKLSGSNSSKQFSNNTFSSNLGLHTSLDQNKGPSIHTSLDQVKSSNAPQKQSMELAQIKSIWEHPASPMANFVPSNLLEEDVTNGKSKHSSFTPQTVEEVGLTRQLFSQMSKPPSARNLNNYNRIMPPFQAKKQDSMGSDGAPSVVVQQVRALESVQESDESMQNYFALDVTTLKNDGAVYTGQVVKHGFGKEVDKYGNLFEGQWYMDKTHGQGKRTYKDGSTYEGAWNAGKFNGQGTLTISDSSMTLGKEDVSDRPTTILQSLSSNKSVILPNEDLQGALEVPYARYYQGQFVNGVANGMATITFCQSQQTKSAKFEGKIKAGRMHGVGSMTMKDGSVKEGMWVDNYLATEVSN